MRLTLTRAVAVAALLGAIVCVIQSVRFGSFDYALLALVLVFIAALADGRLR